MQQDQQKGVALPTAIKRTTQKDTILRAQAALTAQQQQTHALVDKFWHSKADCGGGFQVRLGLLFAIMAIVLVAVQVFFYSNRNSHDNSKRLLTEHLRFAAGQVLKIVIVELEFVGPSCGWPLRYYATSIFASRCATSSSGISFSRVLVARSTLSRE